MKDFFQYRESLTEAADPYKKTRKTLEQKKSSLVSQFEKVGDVIMKLKLPRDAKKYEKLEKEQDKLIKSIQSISTKLSKLPPPPPPPINSLWKTKPEQRTLRSITKLFDKKITSTNKVSEGFLDGDWSDVLSLFVTDSIETGIYKEYYDYEWFDISDIPKTYHNKNGIDWGSLENNPKDFSKFKKKAAAAIQETEWKNIRSGRAGAFSGGLSHVLKSKNSLKDLTIKVGEGSEGYFVFSHKIYYVEIEGSDELVLISKKELYEKDIAETVERMIFDGHKSVKGKYK